MTGGGRTDFEGAWILQRVGLELIGKFTQRSPRRGEPYLRDVALRYCRVGFTGLFLALFRKVLFLEDFDSCLGFAFFFGAPPLFFDDADAFTNPHVVTFDGAVVLLVHLDTGGVEATRRDGDRFGAEVAELEVFDFVAVTTPDVSGGTAVEEDGEGASEPANTLGARAEKSCGVDALGDDDPVVGAGAAFVFVKVKAEAAVDLAGVISGAFAEDGFFGKGGSFSGGADVPKLIDPAFTREGFEKGGSFLGAGNLLGGGGVLVSRGGFFTAREQACREKHHSEGEEDAGFENRR